jgi:hypothetical protein
MKPSLARDVRGRRRPLRGEDPAERGLRSGKRSLSEFGMRA